MDFKVKIKMQVPKILHTNLGSSQTPKAHPWISDYLEEELLIITSINAKSVCFQDQVTCNK